MKNDSPKQNQVSEKLKFKNLSRLTFHVSRLTIFLSLFTLLFSFFNYSSSKQNLLVNFNHLEKLSEIISFQGDSVGIVHIYSEFPDYKWVDAHGEGIACVDDVARAAVLRLKHYEMTQDKNSLKWARAYLKFVLKMQTEDGNFYNFIDKNHEINREGRTSFKSFGWWAVRGYWAFAEGYKIFNKSDLKFAKELKKSFLRCKPQIQNILQNYPKVEEVNGRNYSTWLVNRHAADATAVLIQAMVAYLSVQPDLELEKWMHQLNEGLVQMQLGEEEIYSGAFLAFPDIWHAWGNSQTIALSQSINLSNDNSLLKNVQKEINQFFPLLLLQDGKNEFHVSDQKELQFPQIAYGVRCFSLGALESFNITSDTANVQLAGLLASWLFGNNPANKQMYDPNTGRGFDGIINTNEINQNAGAESTIEALLALLEIENNSIARDYLFSKSIGESEKIQLNKLGSCLYKIYKLEDESQFYFLYSEKNRGFKFIDENIWEKFVKLN